MSFLYPRTIAVTRPGARTGVGAQTSYGAEVKTEETSVLTGVPASIQLRREGQKGAVGLPGDGTRPTWDVFMPRGSANYGVVLDRDIITDDQGRRYQVLGDYIDSLGGKIRVERLEA